MTTDELKERLTEGLKAVRRLRDEARVEVHLAAMEARKQWEVFEPKVAQKLREYRRTLRRQISEPPRHD